LSWMDSPFVEWEDTLTLIVLKMTLVPLVVAGALVLN